MNGFEFAVEVVRTNRKRSVSIHLYGEGVKIRVPRFLTDSQIRAALKERTPWILRKLKEQAKQPIKNPKKYVTGELFPYLGNHYCLKIIEGNKTVITLQADCLIVTFVKTKKPVEEIIKSKLIAWYRKHSQLYLNVRTQRWAGLIGVVPASVKTRYYKARWGSCSIKGDITYNWQIILAPQQIVDYVIVHELCHMIEHNHSPKYWQIVTNYMPDWKTKRDWLKSNDISIF